MISGAGQAPSAQTALVYLAIVALLVLRFAFRELRTRRMKGGSIFVLPVIFGVLSLFLIGQTHAIAPALAATLAIAAVAAVVVGIGLGLLVAKFTSVRRAPDGSFLVLGSWITVGIWIGALLLRLVGRFALAAETTDVASTLLLNSALVVMLTAALTTVRVRVLAIGSESPVPAVEPSPSL